MPDGSVSALDPDQIAAHTPSGDHAGKRRHWVGWAALAQYRNSPSLTHRRRCEPKAPRWRYHTFCSACPG